MIEQEARYNAALSQRMEALRLEKDLPRWKWWTCVDCGEERYLNRDGRCIRCRDLNMKLKALDDRVRAGCDAVFQPSTVGQVGSISQEDINALRVALVEEGEKLRVALIRNALGDRAAVAGYQEPEEAPFASVSAAEEPRAISFED